MSPPPSPIRAAIRELISVKAMTKQELSKALNCSHPNICGFLEDMRDEIYIAGWKRSKRGPQAPRWKLGHGEDAKKPRNLTPAEKSRRWRQTQEGKERRKEYARHYQQAVAARTKIERAGVAAIDPLLAAVMGVR